MFCLCQASYTVLYSTTVCMRIPGPFLFLDLFIYLFCSSAGAWNPAVESDLVAALEILQEWGGLECNLWTFGRQHDPRRFSLLLGAHARWSLPNHRVPSLPLLIVSGHPAFQQLLIERLASPSWGTGNANGTGL